VTICSYQRQCSFGDDERVILEHVWSNLGKYARGAWGDTFTVMPNHVHGIVWLKRDPGKLSPVPPREDGGPAFVVPAGSLAAVVRGFKSAATKRINRLRNTPGVPVWQGRYHDRIVRAGDAVERIRQYIIDNPRKWADDPNNPANLSSPPAITGRPGS
jgi:REP element-mobilizing transposase RayT